MEVGDAPADNSELGRLASVAAAMARSREVCRSGRGQIRTALAAHGIGDWSGSPRAVRSVALACRLCRDEETRRAFSRLVLHAEAHAGRLLHRWSSDRRGDAVFALLRLAERYAEWRRAPEGWRPTAATARSQFGQLARFLLGSEAGAVLVRELSEVRAPGLELRVGDLLLGPYGRGRGSSPLPLTRRMVGHLAGSSHARSPIAALRWSQIAGLDGSPALCRAIAFGTTGSRIWDPREESWWLSAYG